MISWVLKYNIYEGEGGYNDFYLHWMHVYNKNTYLFCNTLEKCGVYVYNH